MTDRIEDRELAGKIIEQVRSLRLMIDAVGNRRIRQAMDDYLCRVYLLARDGHEGNANGGRKPEYRCKHCGAPSWIHPLDQEPPPDYCHESDHGEPPEPEPDAYCHTNEDGSCVSADPRCMHNAAQTVHSLKAAPQRTPKA